MALLKKVNVTEDVVQEVWLRWQRTDRSAVVSPVAFLVPWLPETVDTSVDPAVGAQRAEAVELALLLVLEKLGPTGRAAYILREASTTLPSTRYAMPKRRGRSSTKTDTAWSRSLPAGDGSKCMSLGSPILRPAVSTAAIRPTRDRGRHRQPHPGGGGAGRHCASYGVPGSGNGCGRSTSPLLPSLPYRPGTTRFCDRASGSRPATGEATGPRMEPEVPA